MFEGGANTVYTYRLGTGGTKASLTLTEGLTATAKYEGSMAISLAVQAKLGDSTKKQLLVYVGNALMETWDFTAGSSGEGASLIKAVADSQYITVSGTAATIPTLAVASGALEGGRKPDRHQRQLLRSIAAFEPYYYNTIALDKDDDTDLTLSPSAPELPRQRIQARQARHRGRRPEDLGRLCNQTRKGAAFNDAKVVYLGGGWMCGNESKDGVLAICYAAGRVAATPSNKGITHTVINGATGALRVDFVLAVRGSHRGRNASDFPLR